MPRSSSAFSSALVLAALLATTAAGQSVSDIVDGMYAAYERQVSGVDNYTLVQSMMGVETVSYFEKQMVDGKPVFRSRGSGMPTFMGLGLGEEGSVFGPDLVEHGTYAGREEIDGDAVHVIAVDDLSQLDFSQTSGPGNMEFAPKSARMFVDVDRMVLRRIEFQGEVATDRGVEEVSMQMDMQDFRDYEGLLIPHRTVMEVGGVEALIHPEMQAQLGEMERQLAALPPDQRQMLERMLGPQMEQIRRMMSGGGGEMTMEILVTEVRVNTGPPTSKHMTQDLEPNE